MRFLRAARRWATLPYPPAPEPLRIALRRAASARQAPEQWTACRRRPASEEPQTTQTRASLACRRMPGESQELDFDQALGKLQGWLGRRVRVAFDNAAGPEGFVFLRGRLKAGADIDAPLSEPLADIGPSSSASRSTRTRSSPFTAASSEARTGTDSSYRGGRERVGPGSPSRLTARGAAHAACSSSVRRSGRGVGGSTPRAKFDRTMSASPAVGNRGTSSALMSPYSTRRVQTRTRPAYSPAPGRGCLRSARPFALPGMTLRVQESAARALCGSPSLGCAAVLPGAGTRDTCPWRAVRPAHSDGPSTGPSLESLSRHHRSSPGDRSAAHGGPSSRRDDQRRRAQDETSRS